MKILFLSHKFYPDIGGIEVNSEVIAASFSEAGHQVILATWTSENGTRSFPFDIERNPDVKKLFALHNWADLVFENNPCLRLAWPCVFTRKPYVLAINTWITRIDGKMGWQDIVKRKWLQHAAAVIAVSNAVRERSWASAIVIGNPYRNKLFRIKAEVAKTKDFVFLGRLVTDKGVDFAIRALDRFLKSSPQNSSNATDVVFTVIGEGSERTALGQLVNDLHLQNNVVFAGSLTGEELVDCLNAHRYLLVPSVWEEPFGNVAIEGMACGCIPIVSDGGGLPDAVGNAGVLYKRNNLDSFVSAIQSVYYNDALKQQLLKAAPAHLQAHEPGVVGKKYLEVVAHSVAK